MALEEYHSQIADYLLEEHQLEIEVEEVHRLINGSVLLATDDKGRKVAVALVGEGTNEPELVSLFYRKL